ncbi:LOW QUALITY PROTEIN: vitamin D3 hydroxylase-associated protein-like [Erinaceus europaeus]|uniref:fatty acid amide hydrolase n=1 Tax=Erinaceus europaeus TaxID=9365 RepID=A0ABM3XP90_ERIEU|nr:LOW QUALITY PROTEIN: vitamin D3 hydroxylase-associated protein-like [Erinaceus europaeus]
MPGLRMLLQLPPAHLAAPLGALLLGWGAGFLLRRWISRRRLAQRVALAQEERARLVAQAEAALVHFRAQHPEVQAESIRTLPLSELREQLQKDTLSSEHVLYTYLGKALEVHRALNCLTSTLPWEEPLWELQQQERKGFLHGVPISLKDNYGCKGLSASCGLVKWLGVPTQEDCVLVRVLRSQGALPFVKTSVSQAMLSYYSYNPIYGKTLHPHNPDRLVGGSSSGEAALIAAGGSPVGLGSDLGGSIRIPAAFCGICGLKPTASRLSSWGVVKTLNSLTTGRPPRTFCPHTAPAGCAPVPLLGPGLGPTASMWAVLSTSLGRLYVPGSGTDPGIARAALDLAPTWVALALLPCPPVSSAVGPMARDVDSLALLLHALLCDEMFRLDPLVPPLPFNQEVYSSRRPLRVGYYESDGYSQPTPSMRRAVQHAYHLLQGAGHQLVPFSVPRIDLVVSQFFWGGLMADGQENIYSCLKDEPVERTLQSLFRLSCYPRFFKRILSLIWRPLCPQVAQNFRLACGVRSVKELWRQQEALKEYQHEFMEQWQALQLDVLICPCPCPAPSSVFVGHVSLWSYTILYNVINFPAGTVPVGRVTEQDEEELKDYKGYHQDLLGKNVPEASEAGQGHGPGGGQARQKGRLPPVGAGCSRATQC